MIDIRNNKKLRDQLASRDAEIVVLRQAALDYDKRWHEEQVRCDQLREELAAANTLIRAYRDYSDELREQVKMLRVILNKMVWLFSKNWCSGDNLARLNTIDEAKEALSAMDPKT